MATAGPRNRMGPPGTKWFHGNGPPTSDIPAKKGDMYLDLETGDVYVFE